MRKPGQASYVPPDSLRIAEQTPEHRTNHRPKRLHSRSLATQMQRRGTSSAYLDKFCDEIVAIGEVPDVEQLDNVRVLHSPQQRHFILHQFLLERRRPNIFQTTRNSCSVMRAAPFSPCRHISPCRSLSVRPLSSTPSSANKA